MESSSQPKPKKREESRVFTVWVHIGYTILILSCISWMVYIEYILD